MSVDPQGLDGEELLHFALAAMEQGNEAEAMGFLKRAVALGTSDGKPYFLLAAIHGQLGMHRRAIGELSEAVLRSPDLYAAHFQLGLMHMIVGELDDARDAWAALDALGPEESLRLFKQGLEKLMDDDVENAIATLERGIEASDDDGLNDDMRGIIRKAEETLAAGAQAKEAEGQHVLLAPYRTPLRKP